MSVLNRRFPSNSPSLRPSSAYPLVTWNVWDVGVLVAPPRTQCRPLMRGGVSVRDALQVRGEGFAVVVALLLLHVRFVERNVVFHERRFVQRLVVHLPSNGASLCTHQPISSARIVLSSAAPARMASRQGSQCVCVCVCVCVCARARRASEGEGAAPQGTRTG